MKGTGRPTPSAAWRPHHLVALTFALSTSIIVSAPHAADAFSSPPPGGVIVNNIIIGPSSRRIHNNRDRAGCSHRNRIIFHAPPSSSSSSSSSRLHVGGETSRSWEQRPTPADMKSRDIQAELGRMDVSYADCFDRDSLERRLVEARDGSASTASVGGAASSVEAEKEGAVSTSILADVDPTSTTEPSHAAPAESSTGGFDREVTLAELRNLRVRELRVRLSEMKVRWGTMIEKEEMVRALCDAMEERYVRGANYSRTGILIPGAVADIDEGALIGELGWSESELVRDVAAAAAPPASGRGNDVVTPPPSTPSRHPPLLLDVYATWCGPCQFMAPLLAKAAEEFGPDVRVVKLDSDKHPRIASALKVGGLPTLILFDGGDVSREIQRVEGALTKDQIIDFVNGNFRR